MQKTFITAISAFVLSTASLAAQSDPYAGDKIYIVTKQTSVDGGGRFALSDLPAVEKAALELLPPPPEGVTALIIEEGKPPRYSTASPEEIDKLLGGDGTFEIELFDNRYLRKKPIDLDLANGKAPEDLFDNLPSGTIQPIDGVWTASLVSKDIVGCPAQVASAVGGQDLRNASKSLTFSTPFKPSDLSGEFGRFQWNKASSNVWKSIILEESQGPVAAKKSMEIGLVSETEMSFVSKFELKLPAAARKIVGGGAKCSATIVGKYVLSK